MKRVDRELRIWSKISHENVLEFLGLCLFWRPNRPLSEGALLSLVSPWMKNGTSTQYLRNNPDVDRLDIVRLCYLSLPRSYHLHSLKVIGAYHGLSHLHSKGIIHGDIKGVRGLDVTSRIRFSSHIGQLVDIRLWRPGPRRLRSRSIRREG